MCSARGCERSLAAGAARWQHLLTDHRWGAVKHRSSPKLTWLWVSPPKVDFQPIYRRVIVVDQFWWIYSFQPQIVITINLVVQPLPTVIDQKLDWQLLKSYV